MKETKNFKKIPYKRIPCPEWWIQGKPFCSPREKREEEVVELIEAFLRFRGMEELVRKFLKSREVKTQLY